MTNFEIGQKCVCVDDSFPAWVHQLYTALPKKDQVYVIRDIKLGGYPKGKKVVGAVQLLLIGLVNPKANSKAGHEYGFNSERFRPLEELQEENKNKKPELKLEELFDLLYEIKKKRQEQEHETPADNHP